MARYTNRVRIARYNDISLTDISTAFPVESFFDAHCVEGPRGGGRVQRCEDDNLISATSARGQEWRNACMGDYSGILKTPIPLGAP